MFDKESFRKDLEELSDTRHPPHCCRISLATLVVSCFVILMLSGWFMADLWAAIHR